MEQKIGLALSGCELPQLAFPGGECDFDAAGQSPKRDGFLIDAPCQISVVKREASERFESALRIFIEFVSVCHLRCTAYGHLSRNSERISQFAVRELLERVLGKRLLPPCLIAQPITRLICRAQELIERTPLLSVWEQFNSCGKFQ